MRLGAHPMASAPDPAADWGSAGGSTTAAGSEPPGLRRSHAGHPPTSWPYPEQHRQHFRSVELGDNGRPFVMAQQLRDACRKWLMAEERDVKDVLDLVVLEQTIQLAEDHLVACPGVSEPLLNLSLSNPSPSLSALSRPIPAPRSRSNAPPRTPRRKCLPGEQIWDTRGRSGERWSRRSISTFLLSPPISWPYFCRWGGGKAWAGLLEMQGPGHFQGQCPMMEVGALIRVPDSPGAAPDQAGQYQIPVSIKGDTYQALVASGCNQTSIHQSLMQQRALDTSRKVRCVHGDVVNYPLVPVSIQFQGKTHRMKVAVNSHLRHPLILGTDWPAFTQLLGILCADASLETGRGNGEAMAQTGDAVSGPSQTGSEETRARAELKPPEVDDFPLEQSRDETLKYTYDRVRTIDGQLLQPDQPLSYPYFSLIKDRLYRVTQDTQAKVNTTQLLVPKSLREILFQAAHCSPMAGHLGEVKTHERLMARFFWPGIHENVRRWCFADVFSPLPGRTDLIQHHIETIPGKWRIAVPIVYQNTRKRWFRMN